MRIYISGKIGEEVVSDATREKFARAEHILCSKGYSVFNPTTREYGEMARRFVEKYNKVTEGVFRPRKLYDQIMLMDLDAVSTCHAICMLPDWRQSPGARLELEYAQLIGMDVYELTDDDEMNILPF